MSKGETLNYTRNDNFERGKSDLNRYSINNKGNNNIMNNNTARNNIKFQNINRRRINQQNFNDIRIPAFSNIMSINNGNIIKKNVISAATSYRANSSKTKTNQHKIINYKNFM